MYFSNLVVVYSANMSVPFIKVVVLYVLEIRKLRVNLLKCDLLLKFIWNNSNIYIMLI